VPSDRLQIDVVIVVLVVGVLVVPNLAVGVAVVVTVVLHPLGLQVLVRVVQSRLVKVHDDDDQNPDAFNKRWLCADDGRKGEVSCWRSFCDDTPRASI
jgi:hypothetical protein